MSGSNKRNCWLKNSERMAHAWLYPLNPNSSFWWTAQGVPLATEQNITFSLLYTRMLLFSRWNVVSSCVVIRTTVFYCGYSCLVLTESQIKCLHPRGGTCETFSNGVKMQGRILRMESVKLLSLLSVLPIFGRVDKTLCELFDLISFRFRQKRMCDRSSTFSVRVAHCCTSGGKKCVTADAPPNEFRSVCYRIWRM